MFNCKSAEYKLFSKFKGIKIKKCLNFFKSIFSRFNGHFKKKNPLLQYSQNVSHFSCCYSTTQSLPSVQCSAGLAANWPYSGGQTSIKNKGETGQPEARVSIWRILIMVGKLNILHHLWTLLDLFNVSVTHIRFPYTKMIVGTWPSTHVFFNLLKKTLSSRGLDKCKAWIVKLVLRDISYC